MTYRQCRGVFYLALGCACLLLGLVVGEPHALWLSIVGVGFVAIS